MTIHRPHTTCVAMTPDVLQRFTTAFAATMLPRQECEMTFTSRLQDPYPGSIDTLVVHGTMRVTCNERRDVDPLAAPVDLGHNTFAEMLGCLSRIIPSGMPASFDGSGIMHLPDGRTCSVRLNGSVAHVPADTSLESTPDESSLSAPFEIAA